MNNSIEKLLSKTFGLVVCPFVVIELKVMLDYYNSVEVLRTSGMTSDLVSIY